MRILVTGAAGFIGAHTTKKLVSQGHEVTGVDNVNAYYDQKLKNDRIKNFLDGGENKINFVNVDVSDQKSLSQVFEQQKKPFDRVIHLAAQAGVRYSIQNPHAYGDANLTGFLNLLEECRQAEVPHLIFASSSSVYGANNKTPFDAKNQSTEHPLSLYAATKKANEMMAHAYAHLYQMPVTGLRFFTVYGPWGRPDMAYYLFTKKIMNGETIDVFNNGNNLRDFTYIDDIVEGIIRVMDRIPKGNEQFNANDPSESTAPYKIFNIGNNNPVKLSTFIKTLEEVIGIEAKKNYVKAQPGDMIETSADVSDLKNEVGFAPNTKLKDGLREFVKWYREYHGNKK